MKLLDANLENLCAVPRLTSIHCSRPRFGGWGDDYDDWLLAESRDQAWLRIKEGYEKHGCKLDVPFSSSTSGEREF